MVGVGKLDTFERLTSGFLERCSVGIYLDTWPELDLEGKPSQAAHGALYTTLTVCNEI